MSLKYILMLFQNYTFFLTNTALYKIINNLTKKEFNSSFNMPLFEKKNLARNILF
jgi:hypothetical protein